MAEFVAESSIAASRESLYAWHASAGAFDRLVPPWENVRLARFDGIRNGDLAILKLRQGPVTMSWYARHEEHTPGHGFVDVQESGPFRRWRHHHQFMDENGSSSLLRDSISMAPTGLAVPDRFAFPLLSERLRRQFVYRHRTTSGDLDAHQRSNVASPLKVVITGANGLVGSALAAFLETGGHTVVRVVRRQGAVRSPHIVWDPEKGPPSDDVVSGADALVHLMGAPVDGGRWTTERKKVLISSRVDSTAALSTALARHASPTPRFLVAGGISAYGLSRPGVLREDSPTDPESGFLPALCEAWESATGPASSAGIRVSTLRMGPVLHPAGGMLKGLLRTARARIAATPGTGRQFVSWVALDDVLGAILHALRPASPEGPINVTAPQPCSMGHLVEALAGIIGASLPMSIPEGLVRSVFGEMADETALSNLHVVPDRLLASGYAFRHPNLEHALRHVLGAIPVDHHPEITWHASR